MLQPIIAEIANQFGNAKCTDTDQSNTPAEVRSRDYLEEPLYVRLQSFAFDKSGAALPFSARLARNCMWTPEYAYRVCEEYLRFIYLVCTTDQTLTPSNDVDEAWHLHLSYTESYWNDLCADTLGRALHHTPTEGGEEQQLYYRDCYIQTLRLYETVFDERPPPDIWPDVDARFRNADAMRIVDTSRYWLIPKIPAWVYRVVGMISGVILVAAGGSGVGAEIHTSVPPTLFTIGAGGLAWSVFTSQNFLITFGTDGSVSGGGCGGCGGCGG
jgi:hypothetical protein